MKLLLPSTKYKESFLKALKEFKKDTNNVRGFKKLSYSEVKKDFASYVKKIRDRSRGIGLPKSFVPNTSFWLIDNDKFIGEIDIRHRLTKQMRAFGGHIGYTIRPSKRGKGYGTHMLKLGLKKAKKLGINRALVMCDDDNIASATIIEKNGGKFKDKVKVKGRKILVRRYWITNK